MDTMNEQCLRYEVPTLMMTCKEVLRQDVDKNNAFEIFTVAHCYSLPDLKEKAFEKIKKSMPGKTLDESLKNDPEKLQIIFEAIHIRAKKLHALFHCDISYDLETDVPKKILAAIDEFHNSLKMKNHRSTKEEHQEI